MISKQQVKFINSLSHKKFRKQYQMFVAEGAKIVDELLQSSLKIHKIFATDSWLTQNSGLFNDHYKNIIEEISEKELAQISELSTPNEVLAIAYIPENKPDNSINNNPGSEITVALESVRDPGNLGTIIRLADWYGLPFIVCSPDCVDAYSSKVVQASMGSIFRIKIITADLFSYINESSLPAYAALLDGAQNLHELQEFDQGILIIGNESKGISKELASLAKHKIYIPSFGKAESLNAAMATGIFLDNFRRLQQNNIKK